MPHARPRRRRRRRSRRADRRARPAVATATGAGRYCAHLLGEQRRVLAGGERDDLAADRDARRRRERAPADRSGRAENGDALHATSAREQSRRPARRTGSASMRSSMPPWPGIRCRAVLHAGAALEQRLEQIAGDAETPRAAARSTAAAGGVTLGSQQRASERAGDRRRRRARRSRLRRSWPG